MVRGTSEDDSQRPHVVKRHPSGPRPNRSARRLAGAVALVCALLLVVLHSPASAATEYVDGISDQSLPNWDSGFASSYFAGFFGNTWISGGHIRLARYVVQWNVIS